MFPGILGSFSLIEWLIFSFIGANLAIVGVCLLHNGVKKLDPPAKE